MINKSISMAQNLPSEDQNLEPAETQEETHDNIIRFPLSAQPQSFENFLQGEARNLQKTSYSPEQQKALDELGDIHRPESLSLPEYEQQIDSADFSTTIDVLNDFVARIRYYFLRVSLRSMQLDRNSYKYEGFQRRSAETFDFLQKAFSNYDPESNEKISIKLVRYSNMLNTWINDFPEISDIIQNFQKINTLFSEIQEGKRPGKRVQKIREALQEAEKKFERVRLQLNQIIKEVGAHDFRKNSLLGGKLDKQTIGEKLKVLIAFQHALEEMDTTAEDLNDLVLSLNSIKPRYGASHPQPLPGKTMPNAVFPEDEVAALRLLLITRFLEKTGMDIDVKDWNLSDISELETAAETNLLRCETLWHKLLILGNAVNEMEQHSSINPKTTQFIRDTIQSFSSLIGRSEYSPLKDKVEYQTETREGIFSESIGLKEFQEEAKHDFQSMQSSIKELEIEQGKNPNPDTLSKIKTLKELYRQAANLPQMDHNSFLNLMQNIRNLHTRPYFNEGEVFGIQSFFISLLTKAAASQKPKGAMVLKKMAFQEAWIPEDYQAAVISFQNYKELAAEFTKNIDKLKPYIHQIEDQNIRDLLRLELRKMEYGLTERHDDQILELLIDPNMGLIDDLINEAASAEAEAELEAERLEQENQELLAEVIDFPTQQQTPQILRGKFRQMIAAAAAVLSIATALSLGFAKIYQTKGEGRAVASESDKQSADSSPEYSEEKVSHLIHKQADQDKPEKTDFELEGSPFEPHELIYLNEHPDDSTGYTFAAALDMPGMPDDAEEWEMKWEEMSEEDREYWNKQLEDMATKEKDKLPQEAKDILE